MLVLILCSCSILVRAVPSVIMSYLNHMCLDVPGGNFATFANGVRVRMWDCIDGVLGQQWTWDTAGRLRAGNTNFCLEVAGGGMQNGVIIQIWTCIEVANHQRWTLDEENRFRPVHAPAKVLDITSMNANIGTLLQLWDPMPSDHQKWFFGESRAVSAMMRLPPFRKIQCGRCLHHFEVFGADAY